VNEFVEACRREWSRLRVPDPIANEMATDLAADLNEAEAEGVSPEEVLGSGAFDPRSFAASWAAERGVGRPSPAREPVPRRSFILAAIAALAAIAVSGAALAIFTSPSGSASAPAIFAPRPSGPPEPRLRTVVPQDLQAEVSGADTGAIGLVLLIVGLTGIVLLALFWLWVGRGRWSRRQAYLDDRPTGSAY
jgi:hypothetical protein